ncbi:MULTISPECIES: non-ribosomal peptide synthetase [Paenibacillus]|uniref:non-ribosomal peptide synthetase n=1 Tax=Paenibacillus TaxID=44249 RepID=UPI0022B8A801|nr:non-ribosomal peptide synthetase [Paenibacillus caseinilyticus]MCZ8521907.1 amino acid adenylation domain-containing protein [Paenibacillus caseinilyticus]
MNESTKQRYPLTQAQQRIWYMEMMNPGTTLTMIGGTLMLQGNINEPALERAIRQVLWEHDAFRIRFGSDAEGPCQWFEDKADFTPEFDTVKVQGRAEAEAWMEAFSTVPLPMMGSKLYHFAVLLLGDGEYWVTLKLNHLIADGLSANHLLRFVTENYIGITSSDNQGDGAGAEPSNVPLLSSYLDYIQAEQEYEASERYVKDRAYWLDKFSSMPEVTGLKPYPSYSISSEARRSTYTVKGERYGQLKRFSEERNISIFNLFLGAVYILLYKLTGYHDIPVGTMYANRTNKKDKEAIGMFASTVATRVALDGEQELFAVLQEVSKAQKSDLRHQKYPYNRLIEDLRKEHGTSEIQELFRVSLEYLPLRWSQYENLRVFQMSTFFGHEGDDFLVRVDDMFDEEEIFLHITYRTQLFSEEEIDRLREQLLTIVDCVLEHPNMKVRELSVLGDDERERIQHVFNPAPVPLPEGLSALHRRFEEWAAQSPDLPAVADKENRLTYGELNARANRLARMLVSSGVGRESLVGIMADRSVDLLVGVLAVWKAGGAYVPIDPDYPADRIRYMLEDSKAAVLLTQTPAMERVEQWRQEGLALEHVFCLDDGALRNGASENLPHLSDGSDLAYLIYTSGTTGRPKGVMIEHRSLLNTADAYRREYRLGEFPVRLLQLASFSFDVFVGDIARTLYNGGMMVICPKEDRIDPQRLYGWIRDEEITVFESTPALIIPFMDHLAAENIQLPSMKLLITSSDSCSVADYRVLQERFGSQFRIINAYGVTEAAIDSSFYDEPLSALPESGNVPIGRAWLNASFQIVDPYLNPVPVGVLGELCIGGSGVARGYWGQPELTSEKFVMSPFAAGERLYRTGDLARWTADGQVDFIGRIDYQVKIRGFRIELGEIETALLRFGGVRQAVVVDLADDRGQKYLCGYVAADESLDLAALQTSLEQELPVHMVPARMMRLDRLPLTPNGKIDRKALPVPQEPLRAAGTYDAPRTEIEKAIAAAWQEILGIERVGRRDHFFQLGGDSIKSIQVSSRLHRAGYKLDVRDLFKYPTIAALGAQVQPLLRLADQGEVKGEAELTPVQSWFFHQSFADPHHYNQSMLLRRTDRFDEQALRQVLQKLTEHHDALRMVFSRQADGRFRAYNRGIGEGEAFTLETADFRGAGDPAAEVGAHADALARSLRLEEGPLFKAGLYRCDDGDHLYLAIHHLVIDGVSWRILLEDLALGYEQASRGEAVRLPAKTDAYRSWGEKLALYAQSPALQAERDYWSRFAALDIPPLRKDYEAEAPLQQSSESVTVRWNEDETRRLLQEVHRAYRTEMNDILLTALALAVSEWSGENRVLVNLEGHGREEIVPDTDMTRTVGWFTSEYPVLLETLEERNLSRQIKKIKEDLRGIPNKGIGYGICRYLPGGADSASERAAWGAEPSVSFNYLGQFDQDLEKGGVEFSPYPKGADVSENQVRGFLLDINGMVSGGSLVMDLSYSSGEYRRETVEELAGCLHRSLQEIIAHCTAIGEPVLTPSDVQVKGMTVEELDGIVEAVRELGELENIYPLTPMQKGMWFHHTLDREATAYFEVTRFRLRGELDVEAFSLSWNRLAQRHEALRTGFYGGWRGEPLQLVYREKPVGFAYEDLRGLTAEQQELRLAEIEAADKLQGFDLEKDALMRVTVTRTEEQGYHVLWTSHHIIMDGWCLPLIAGELLETYRALVGGGAPELSEAPSYARYIEWLEHQDSEAAGSYWQGLLSGYEGQTVLPHANTPKPGDVYEPVHTECRLNPALSGRLSAVAREYQVTLNTLMQAVWGILLQKYNGTDDVVFGGVVSGRPADIQGIEEMIGLFINTIPVRVACSPEESAAEVMKKLQESALASARYDTYPLYEIQARTAQKQSLISHVVAFENYPMDEQLVQAAGEENGELRITDVEVAEQTNYDFTLMIIPGDEIRVHADYNGSVFERSGIERLMGHLVHVLGQIASNPHIPVGELELSTEPEVSEIMEIFNDTDADYPGDATIHGLFEQQAQRTPDAVAVIFEGESLTYRELDRRANRLAHTLRSLGAGPDGLVGLMARRSLDMIVGIIAILKSGGAYVPIDPEYPEERIAYMLQDSGAKLLLVQRELQEQAAFEGTVILLDDERSYAGPEDSPQSGAGPEHLAYVIYTSGTTGKPKGTLIEHRNVARLLFNNRNLFDFGTGDTWTFFHSFCFDFSVWEMYGALLYGGRLVVVPALTAKNPAQFLQLLKEQQVTILNQTPTYFYQLLREALAEEGTPLQLRQVIFGGEALSPQLLREWRSRYPAVQLINMYGITETTVHVTYKEITEREMEQGKSNIGRPIPTLQVYILDGNGKHAPAGVAGEMYVAGAGLARGYLNRPELTAEKFVPNPFVPGERMYKSGDLARWMPDGSIEYLGRIDHQVKIRGYRIELGEVESRLLDLGPVQEAIVLARQDAAGQPHLCAYFVADRTMTVSEIKGLLSEQMPAYMLPTYFVQLERMPLTSNGKTDRKALPAPEESLNTGGAFLAPRTPAEAQLLAIWQEVLGVRRISVTDSFFELGGHSLRATTLVSRVRQEMGAELPLRDVFRYPTIAEMAEALGQTEEKAYAPIPAAAERTYYPVSSAQKRLYILHQLEGAQLSYNMPGLIELQGTLDRSRFEEAFRSLIDRHETLRTGFWMEDGEPVQAVSAAVDFAVEEWPALEGASDDLLNGFVRAFDLAKPPLLRIGLAKQAEDRYLMLFDMHHIISDGVSIDILVEEFTKLYNGQTLNALPLQYKDYAVWQQSEEQSGRRKQEEAYWLRAFAGELPVLEMPADYPRPAVQSYDGETLDFTVDAEVNGALNRLAAESGTTLYMVLLASFKVLLHKYTGQEDIVVGTPIAGRTHGDLQGLIGMFVNTLAVRSYPGAGKTFLTYLGEIKETLLGAYEYQDYPFEELVESLRLARDLSRNPLFDTMFTLQNTENKAFGLEGLELTLRPTGASVSKFDLSLDVTEKDGALECSLEYATSLFKRETAERLAGHFRQLLQAVAGQPEAEIHRLDMLTGSERAELLRAFNPPASDALDAPLHRTFSELFEEQAARTPDRLAVVYEKSELTYGELNGRANQLARTLRGRGVGPGRLVGILADRSVDLLVAVMAVWKAGGAYVPVDPDYPAERIRLMLEDSEASVLLTQTHLKELSEEWLAAGGAGKTVLCLDNEPLFSGDASNLTALAGPSDLAYVIYTSGTTGRPKGVMIEHRSLVNTADGYRREYRLDRFPVRLLQLASFSFDVFVGDIARALYNGGLMVICPQEDRIDPARLHHWIVEREITVFESTPALIVPFMEYVHEQGLALDSMELLITSSDSCSVSDYRTLQERFGSQMRIINAYGVTEAAIDSSFYDEPLSALPAAGSVPIGRAWLNAAFYIVDAYLNPVPVGVLGELCIGGAGVARGYWNREDLTAEKFVDSPFAPGEKLYRTGDLARWTADGQVDFIGRIDHQAKIRGYRIETGEIESLLLQTAGVREAVVAVVEDGSGGKALCAYYAADESGNREEAVTAAGLREGLSQILPGYMIPSYFVQLPKLPLTPNGKIDRKALPKPQGGADSGMAYVAPRTGLEGKLAQIWEKVLGTEQIGVKDNFFERGGHSLRATTLVGRIAKELGAELPLREVFRCPTVEAMALAIRSLETQARAGIPRAEEQPYYPVTSAQKRLFILQQLEGAELSYNMTGFYTLAGKIDRDRFETAFRQLIGRHEILRTGFRMAGGVPVQVVQPAEDTSFLVEYFKAAGEEEARGIASRFVRAFELEQPPLLRAGLIELEAERHILLFDMHHLISDGVSVDILVEEFSRLYGGEELPPLPLQYKDYAVWQNSAEGVERIAAQEAYWLNMFHGELPKLELPTDYARPARRSYEGDALQFGVPLALGSKLEGLAEASGTTLYMVLLAAYSVLLHKYSGQEDIVIGTPVAGRSHADLEPLIGMFVNTLALRTAPAREKRFLAYLEEIREVTLGAYEHGEYPFEELVEKLQAPWDASRNNPLFDTVFALQNTEDTELALGGLTVEPYDDGATAAKFDLVLEMGQRDGGLYGRFEYSTALFSGGMIGNLADDLLGILEQLGSQPDITIGEMGLKSQTGMETAVEEIDFAF